jgi:hypothetical protein
MTRFKQQLFALAAVALFATATPALAQSSEGEWRQTVFLYGMGAMIEGDAQVGPLQVPVVAESGSASCKPSEDRS